MKNKFVDNLKADDLKFYNNPTKYNVSDYDDVIKKLVNISSRYPGILSLYTFGKVGAPGISDLDFIFVLNKRTKLPDFLKKNNFHGKVFLQNFMVDKYFDKKSRYIIYHPFFIVTEEMMMDIRYIYPNSDIKIVYGKDIAIKNPSKKESNKIKNYLNVDIVLHHYPFEYLAFLISREIDVRMALVRMNALSHSFRLFNEISGRGKYPWFKFAREVDLMRKKWFSLDKNKRKQKLLNLLKEAVYLSVDFVKEYDFLLTDKKYAIKNQSVTFNGTKYRILFIKNWNPEKSILQSVELFQRNKLYYSVLPMNFLAQLCYYSSANGILSRYIRKRLSIDYHQINIDKLLEKRIDFLNDQVELSNKLKHSHFSCFFPFGYKTKSGLMNKLALLYILVTNNRVFRRILYVFRK